MGSLLLYYKNHGSRGKPRWPLIIFKHWSSLISSWALFFLARLYWETIYGSNWYQWYTCTSYVLSISVGHLESIQSRHLQFPNLINILVPFLFFVTPQQFHPYFDVGYDCCGSLIMPLHDVGLKIPSCGCRKLLHIGYLNLSLKEAFHELSSSLTQYCC